MTEKIKQENRIKYLPERNKAYFYLDSSQLENDIKFIIDNNIDNIILCGEPYSTYNLNHVNWFSQISHIIKDVSITHHKKNNFVFDGLKYCKDLSCLKVIHYDNEPIDLSNNVHLKRLDIENCKNIIGFENLVEIETLSLNKTPVTMLCYDTFKNFNNLRHMSISNTDLTDGLDFLRGSSISSLSILYCRKLSLHGIAQLSLSSLEIHNCKNIDCLELIFSLKDLKEIKIIDSAMLDTAENFLKINKLESLIVLGSSYFQDGNLNPLKDKLKVFNYDNKRHYNIKWEVFKNSYLKK